MFIKILNMILLNSEQVAQIKKIKDALKRGYYVNGSSVTPLYNEVFQKSLKNTNCSTCIKNRCRELVQVYDKFVEYIQAEEQKQIAEQSAIENNTPAVEEQPKRKAGRPKKTQD